MVGYTIPDKTERNQIISGDDLLTVMSDSLKGELSG